MTNSNSTKRELHQVIDWLIDNFPSAFFKQAKHVKPLKIGIFDDIMDFYNRLDTPPYSKKKIREAINYYSSSPAYLLSQEKNVARVDLYGTEIDIVSEEQARYAQKRYQQHYPKKDNS
jgi:ProP effector